MTTKIRLEKLVSETIGDNTDANLDKLDLFVSDLMLNKKTEDINKLLDEYLNKNETEKFDSLMDSVSAAIENVEVVVDKKSYQSTMQIIPCTFTTSTANCALPSINQMEEILRKKLLSHKIIEHPEQFHLGTVRLSQDAMESMNIDDWWNMHRDMVSEVMSSAKEDNIDKRDENTIIDEKVLSCFFLVCTLISRENNAHIVGNLFESINNVELWTSMFSELESDCITLSILPPATAIEALENVKYDIFWNEYGAKNGVDLAYGEIEGNTDEIAILLYDEEDKSLLQYYKYSTLGDKDDFLKTIIDRCSDRKRVNLTKLNKKITEEQLIQWANGDSDYVIENLLSDGDEIDLKETKRLCELAYPSLNNLNSSSTKH